MADGITTQSSTLATIPSGTEIATDDAGASGHVQIVKLAIAADGSATVLPGDATDGLLVNLGSNNDVTLAAGAEVKITDGTDDLVINADGSINIAGTVTAGSTPTQNQQQTSSGLTTATTNYTLGDVVGAGWTFTSMADASGGHGIITGVAVLDEGDVLEGLALWVSSGSITFGTDNAAPSLSDADSRKLIAGPISVPVSDLGGARFGALSGLRVPYVCDATSLYVYATTLSGNNFFAAATDVKVTFFYEVQD